MIRMMRLLAVAALLAASQSFADRVALVIGNGAYKRDPLNVAVNDATNMKEALEGVGFKVLECYDCCRKEMTEKIAEFGRRLKEGGDAVFYYSGHGTQLGGDNFLIPTDIDPEKFPASAVPVKDIYDELKKTRQMIGIVILDACRDNLLLLPGNRFKGLAAPQTNVYPPGTIIAFATWPNTLAIDDHDGSHSPYTKALLAALGEPGLSINDYFQRVRSIVYDDFTERHQLPWVSTSQMAPFEFRAASYMRVDANADDDLIVSAGGDVYAFKYDGSSKRLRLLPGDNLVNILATNYPSKAGGVIREGWHYDLTLSSTDGTVTRTFHGCEPHDGQPPKWRFGTSFLAARAIVNVDKKTGILTFTAVEPSIWLDGFAITGLPDEKAQLDAAIRWSSVIRGVALFDNAFPGELRPLPVLRAAFVATHAMPHDPAEEDAACEPPDAHLSHTRTTVLLEQATDDDLTQSIQRVLAGENAARPTLEEGLRFAMRVDPNFRNSAITAVTTNDYAFIRFYYPHIQAENPSVREQLATLSNFDLRTAIQHALATP